MPFPAGLTDLDVQIATAEMRREADRLALLKDWRRYNQNRDALVLRFAVGGDVRIPMSRMVLEELRRVARQNTGLDRVGLPAPDVRVLVDDDPKKVAAFAKAVEDAKNQPPRTCWDRLLEDEDPTSI